MRRGGKLAAEYSTAPPEQNPTTKWTVTDQLGSPRVLVDSLGQVVSRRDFMPFGEEITPDGTHRTANLKYNFGDNIRQKFTGYQKDEETQLDFAEARMYQNLHGRFTAVDPLLASGKSANPQTFNRYVYVINNPIILVDPDGLQVSTVPVGGTPLVPNGRWYKPISPDGVQTYRFEASQPDGYEPVTQRNRNGDLIGEFVGGLIGGIGGIPYYVLRFNEMGPMTPLPLLDVRTGQTSMARLTDSELSGYDIIPGPEYRHTGAVQDVSLELFTAATSLARSAPSALRVGAGGRLAAAEFSDDALVSRAGEIHRGLDRIAQTRRTTAIVDTEEGVRLVASSQNTLSPSQRALMLPGEIAVSGKGHAEATALAAAAVRGLTPVRVAASRRICSSCEELIIGARAKPLDPTRFLDATKY